MRKFIVSLAALAFSFAAATAFAQDAKKATDAKTFVTKAAQSNQFEIESSKIALEKATNAQLQQFAKQMIDDHTAVGKKMKEVLQQADMKMPEEAQKLDEKHQEMLQKLKSASGDKFNSTYKQQQEQAHETAIQLFETYAEEGDNQQLQQFASSVLPTLKQHRDQLQGIELRQAS